METANNNTLKYLHWTLAVTLAVMAAAIIFEVIVPQYRLTADAALVVLTTLVCLIAIARQLPWQNTLLAAAITALIGGLAHGLTARFSLPFGPLVFNETTGAKIFYIVPWPVPMLWIIAVFSSRGVGRLILRPWRKVRSYGFWLIGVTTVLTVAFDFALEPLAAHVQHFWLWRATRIPVTWHDTPLLNFFAWAFVTLLILAFATPALIKKKPGERSAPDYLSPAAWFGAMILFAAGCARAGLWDAVIADAVIAVVTLIFTIRGAMW
jgi:uncharacterized membrane protein